MIPAIITILSLLYVAGIIFAFGYWTNFFHEGDSRLCSGRSYSRSECTKTCATAGFFMALVWPLSPVVYGLILASIGVGRALYWGGTRISEMGSKTASKGQK